MISPKIDLTDPRNPENPSNPHWKPPENDMVKLPNGRSVPMNKLEAEHGEQANGANGRRNRRVSINGIVNGHTRNR
ncbi:hypothetical protein DIPPA_31842 [Diplonema papillatum]|nr:hypothetical protein DIPPA_31842 [Diplonema papillatum]